MIRRMLRWLAGGVRRSGGFAGADEVRALARQVKRFGERLGRLEHVEKRLADVRRRQSELRTEVAHLQRAVARLPGDVHDARAALEKRLDGVRRDSRAERRLLERVESQARALLRAAYLRPDDLPADRRVAAQRFGVLSQHGEDGMTLALLGDRVPGGGRFVEIGCADHGWNTGFLAEEAGWQGLMLDSDAEAVAATRLRFPEGTVRTAVARVTPDAIDALLRQEGFAGQIDLLSIDVDGNDYWLWEACTACRPHVVIVEYNAVFGVGRAVVVPYSDGEVWTPAAREHRYLGASLQALVHLGRRKGYRLVAVEPDSSNAFFLCDGWRPEVPAVDPAAVFRVPRKYRKAEQARTRDIYAICEAEGLPLMEVPGGAA